MKHLITMLAAALFALPAMADTPPAPVIGEMAPDFAATDTRGHEVKLSDLKGNIVVLEWTNYDCPFVKKHYSVGNMQKQQSMAANKGVVWVSIVSSAPDKQGHMTPDIANERADKQGATPAHIVLDETGEIGRLYHARTTPHMFVINTDGKLAYMGAIDNKSSTDSNEIATATNYVSTTIAALTNGKAPGVTNTKPYGCSVKY